MGRDDFELYVDLLEVKVAADWAAAKVRINLAVVLESAKLCFEIIDDLYEIFGEERLGEMGIRKEIFRMVGNRTHEFGERMTEKMLEEDLPRFPDLETLLAGLDHIIIAEAG